MKISVQSLRKMKACLEGVNMIIDEAGYTKLDDKITGWCQNPSAKYPSRERFR